MTTMLTKIIERAGYIVAAMIIFLASLVSIGHILTPVLNEHLRDFEVWSSDLLKVPVNIGHVGITWNIYEPEIAFDQVTILDKESKQATWRIQQIKVNLNILRSILARRPLPERLTVSGVHLTLHEPQSGQFHIDEFNLLAVTDKLTGSSVHLKDVVGWIFSQSRLTLDDVDITYHPPVGAEQSISLHQLILENTATSHQLVGDVTLNQEVSTRATVHLQWTGNVMDMQHVSAGMYVYLEGLILPQWLKHFSWKQLHIQEGVGSAKIWATWAHNQFQKIQSQFLFYDVAVESTLTHKKQHFPRMSGHVGWQRAGDKYIFAGEDILINLPHHLWPTTHFMATVVSKNGQQHIESLRVGYLDLSDTQQLLFASGLLPDAFQKKWITWEPKGELRDLHITLPLGEINNFMTIPFGMQFSHLHVKAAQSFPGITNASGTLDWNGKQGSLTLDSQKITLLSNAFFTNPLQFEQLSGQLRWQKDDDGTWSLNGQHLQLSNPDLTVRSSLIAKIPRDDSPLVNLTADFAVKNVAHITHYLPLRLFDADLVAWLRQAFIRGQLDNGKAVLQGKWVDFPFDNKKGTFFVTSAVKDMDLNYAEKWPSLNHINGDLTFAGSSMTANIHSGVLLNTPITLVRATIPYIGEREPQVLDLEGLIATDVAQSLDFIQQSPLQKTIGRDLAGLNLTGPMQLKLNLHMPLRNPDTAKVQGDVMLTDAVLTLPLWDAKLDHLNGAFRFTEQDIEAQNIQGQLFGKPIALDLTTQRDAGKTPYVKATVQGTLSISDLQNALKMSISQYVQGTTPFQAELHVASHDHPQPMQLIMKTDLKGVGVNLPEPLGKKTDQSRPVQFEMTMDEKKPIQTKLVYGELFTVGMNFQKTKQAVELVGGVNLQTKNIYLYGLHLTNPRVDISKVTNNWLINVNSDQLIGQLTLPTNFSSIQGKFQRFYIPESDTIKNQPLLNPKKIPALSITANDVRYGDKKLGSVMLVTAPTQNGMQIRDLHINSPVGNLRATGSWQLINKTYASRLQGALSTNTVNSLLAQWGLNSSALVATDAYAQFNLSWPNEIYHLTPAKMSGSLALRLGHGRIVNLSESTEAKMGLGRMLSIFSLQTIPRRLSLDFSDLFQNGYSFDSINGSFKLKEGNAYTDDTRFTGPVAVIDVAGRIGLQAKDYDLRLSMKTYVTGGLVSMGLSTAAAIGLVNPLAGIASTVVGAVVNQATSKMKSFQYKIVGPWDNPVWEQIGSASPIPGL